MSLGTESLRPNYEAFEYSICSTCHSLLLSIIRVVLFQQLEGLWLRLAAASIPGRGLQGLWLVGNAFLRKHSLKCLGPLDSIVESFQTPKLLQEMKNRAVCVRRVVSVVCALVVNEGVGWNVRGDQEGRHTGQKKKKGKKKTDN